MREGSRGEFDSPVIESHMLTYTGMESPEAPHQHAPHTGHRWFDIALGVSAMFISVITLVVAIEHGRTMERMADANMRMVQANSWPFVELSSHNLNDKGVGEVRLVLTNEGVGPARIETFELWWREKPMSSPSALLNACCAPANGKKDDSLTTLGLAAPRILRAGEHVDFLSVSPTGGGHEAFDKLNTERDYIRTRVCYCSVFDECWVKEGGDALLLKGESKLVHPDPVKACPRPPVPYMVGVETSPHP